MHQKGGEAEVRLGKSSSMVGLGGGTITIPSKCKLVLGGEKKIHRVHPGESGNYWGKERGVVH